MALRVLEKLWHYLAVLVGFVVLLLGASTGTASVMPRPIGAQSSTIDPLDTPTAANPPPTSMLNHADVTMDSCKTQTAIPQQTGTASPWPTATDPYSGPPLLLTLSPSAIGASPTVSPLLRYDGLYRAEGEYIRWLRFYQNGTVLSVSTDGGTPDQIIKWFYKGNPTSPFSMGVYSFQGSQLKFPGTNSYGTVDYQGTIDGLTLTIHWYSHINCNEGTDVYQWVPFPK